VEKLAKEARFESFNAGLANCWILVENSTGGPVKLDLAGDSDLSKKERRKFIIDNHGKVVSEIWLLVDMDGLRYLGNILNNGFLPLYEGEEIEGEIIQIKPEGFENNESLSPEAKVNLMEAVKAINEIVRGRKTEYNS
jgi:hypothetical protein